MIVRKLHSLIRHIFDEIASLYWNFRLFPIRTAIKMPLKVNYTVDFVRYYKGCIQIESAISKHMIRFGETGATFIGKDRGSFFCSKRGKIIVSGPIEFAEGTKICVEEGKLFFGKESYFGCNTSIECTKQISVGSYFLGGWNLSLRDTDGHPVVINGIKKEKSKPIYIGTHVWIGADSVILKGTHISDDSIVACNSVVVGLHCKQRGCLIAGIPAKIKRENINWEE